MARAHHGSLAASQRSEIEEQLKVGSIRALVATSSLELGIDMGAIDLVIQIEAPPSVASGMQRIGRAGHHVGATSDGIIFPKYRADLVACAAVTRAMHEGLVESTRYLRNPLDVLAQQIVAIVAQPPTLRVPRKRGQSPGSPEISVEALFTLVRSAAPFASLTRTAFEGVLDLLAGRYPSDEFAELRPRITWDRVANRSHAARRRQDPRDSEWRHHSRSWPLRSISPRSRQDLSASANSMRRWSSRAKRARPSSLAHPPGASLRSPTIAFSFRPPRANRGKRRSGTAISLADPLEFGRRIGALVRELREMPRNAALSRLVREHDLDPQAAENLIRFLGRSGNCNRHCAR